MRFILLLMFFTTNVFAQKAVLTIGNLVKEKDSVGVTLNILNTGNLPLVIYRPKVKDICYNLLRIKLNNVKTGAKHEIFPCSDIVDLEFLYLDHTNSIYLENGECFVKKLKFSLKDATPFLKKGDVYNLSLELNLKGVPFQSELKEIFFNDLVSNKIKLGYK